MARKTKHRNKKKRNTRKKFRRIRQVGGADIGSIRGNIHQLFSSWYSTYTTVLNGNRYKYTNLTHQDPNYSPSEKELSNFKYELKDDNLFSTNGSLPNKLLEEFVKFIETSGGNKVTYNLDAGDTLESKYFKGNDFPAEGIPDTENVLILGAGPNGSYMATSLKAAMPDLNVNVIESRVTDDGLRNLTRHGTIEIKEGAKTSILFSRLQSQSEIKLREKILSNIPGFFELFNFDEDKYPEYAGKFLYLFLVPPIMGIFFNINSLEQTLAEIGQYLGVNIFHEKAYDIRKYTNSKTLCIFDATGGRFRRLDDFWKNEKLVLSKHFAEDTEETLAKKPQLSVLLDRLKRGESLNMYEGFLPVELSINQQDDIPYVAIGETTLRTNYLNGMGLTFNSFLSLNYILLLDSIRRKFSPEYSTALPYSRQYTKDALALRYKTLTEFQENLPRLLEERKSREGQESKEREKQRIMGNKRKLEESSVLRTLGIPPEIKSMRIFSRDVQYTEAIHDFLFEAYLFYYRIGRERGPNPLNFTQWLAFFYKSPDMEKYFDKYAELIKTYDEDQFYLMIHKYVTNFFLEESKDYSSFILKFRYPEKI